MPLGQEDDDLPVVRDQKRTFVWNLSGCFINWVYQAQSVKQIKDFLLKLSDDTLNPRAASISPGWGNAVN